MAARVTPGSALGILEQLRKVAFHRGLGELAEYRSDAARVRALSSDGALVGVHQVENVLLFRFSPPNRKSVVSAQRCSRCLRYLMVLDSM